MESSNTNNFSVHYYRVKSLDWREGLRPIQPLHFFPFHILTKGGAGHSGGTGSLVAEYIEKRGWFPGQSGSQTYEYEGGVSLGQVLGYTLSSGPGPHPHSGAVRGLHSEEVWQFPSP